MPRRRARPTRNRCRSFSRSAKSALASAARHFLKADGVVRPKLSGPRQIDGDHVRDLGITADRLAIPEQHDRLPVVRHLDGAGRDGLGRQLPAVRPIERRTFQSRAHAVGFLTDGEELLQQTSLRLAHKFVPLRSAENAQDRGAHGGLCPFHRRAPGREPRPICFPWEHDCLTITDRRPAVRVLPSRRSRSEDRSTGCRARAGHRSRPRSRSRRGHRVWRSRIPVLRLA